MMTRNVSTLSTCWVAATAMALAGCSDSTTDPRPTELALGTWGAERVGVVVGEATAHVHVGCTKGDFPAPIMLDSDGRFSVAGSYLIKAYPVAIGPTMPAEFTGVVSGSTLTFTVAVNDTIEGTLEVLGPETAVLGDEPFMGPCPICAGPSEAPAVSAKRHVAKRPRISHAVASFRRFIERRF